MLDRGEQLDWFQSSEILMEIGLFAAALWMFAIHTATNREPFLDRDLFRDRNFAAALMFIFVIGIILLATMALLPPMLQNLFGYPVVTVGLVLAPRGIGTMISMFVVGRLVRQIDPRYLVAFGLSLTAFSLWQMTWFSLEMDEWPVIVSGVVQGFGLGFVFIPLSTIAFTTLHPRLRTDATSLFNLVRNLGSSIGISIMAAMLTRNIQINHASLAAHVTPFNDNLVAAGMDPTTFTSAAGLRTAAQLDGLINAQSAMIAYLDDFKLMMWITLAAAPLLLMLRYNKQAAPTGAPVAAMADRAALRRARRDRLGQQEFLQRLRTGDGEALDRIDADPFQDIDRLDVLDTFRHGLRPELVGDVVDRLDDGAVDAAPLEVLHEGAVDLHEVDGEALQIVEGAEAGAEIVEHDGAARFPRRRHQRVGGGQVLDQRRLGDLEMQPLRAEARLRQLVPQERPEAGIVQRICRQVDRDRQVGLAAYLLAIAAEPPPARPSDPSST